jgi:hypothetical protein
MCCQAKQASLLLNLPEVHVLVPNEFNTLKIFKPDTFNRPFILVSLFNVVVPLTFNDDSIVVLLFNVVKPLTFNDEYSEVLLFNVVKPPIFNEEINVALSFTNNSFKFENPLTLKFEYIVILSDVILFASISFKPVEDKPQQFIFNI